MICPTVLKCISHLAIGWALVIAPLIQLRAAPLKPFSEFAVASDLNHKTYASQSDEYKQDLSQLISLRSHSLDEVLAFGSLLERKWRGMDWNSYAEIMTYVCSEISNRGVGDVRLRRESEKFAKLALSHSRMFSWEYQADLVGALGSRTSPSDTDWVRERREKLLWWLRAWRRLETEFDPTYDVNERKNRPSMQVWPPMETGLRPGALPSAIKEPKLRAQYEKDLAENERKIQRANEQIPLLAHGPAFKARAEHVVIYLYSQSPFRDAELKRLLESHIKDAAARKRILDAVGKNTKSENNPR